ncbi:MAG: Crp/Fnr family transcriptional regulator [Bacteroidia bacterium]|nr:Crp/Fnr family transcriptional regulator [Bacteroidia bacterium]
MSEESNLWYLEEVNLFDFLCPTKLGNMDMSHMVLEFRKGDFIYFPDEPSDRIFLVEEGRVKIGTYSVEGKETTKAILQKGEIFGELALAGEESRHDFARALDEVKVCALHLDDIKNLMLGNKEFSFRITRLIGLKLMRAERRLESLIFKDARTRVIEFIRDMALEKGQKVGDELLIRQFHTHKDVAHLTGTSRQTVTTILNELRDQNLIYFDRKRLLIRNIDNLVAAIQSPPS